MYIYHQHTDFIFFLDIYPIAKVLKYLKVLFLTFGGFPILLPKIAVLIYIVTKATKVLVHHFLTITWYVPLYPCLVLRGFAVVFILKLHFPDDQMSTLSYRLLAYFIWQIVFADRIFKSNR